MSEEGKVRSIFRRRRLWTCVVSLMLLLAVWGVLHFGNSQWSRFVYIYQAYLSGRIISWEPPDNYTGTWRTWFRNGRKCTEAEYKDGKYHGEVTWWHSNGQVSQKMTVRNRKVDGMVSCWQSNGQKWGEILWKNGEVVRDICWHDNGKRKSEYCSDDNGNGTRTTWDKGSLKEIAHYKHGKRIWTETAEEVKSGKMSCWACPVGDLLIMLRRATCYVVHPTTAEGDVPITIDKLRFLVSQAKGEDGDLEPCGQSEEIRLDGMRVISVKHLRTNLLLSGELVDTKFSDVWVETDGKKVKMLRYEITQKQFEELLKTGNLTEVGTPRETEKKP